MSRKSPASIALAGAAPSFLLVALASLAAGAACGQRRSAASFSSVQVEADGSGTARIDGVTFEFDDSVRFQSVSESTTAGSSTLRTTVDGHEFGLRDGQVFVGERLYGPASSGTTVRITRAGVTVGGEPRGALPAPRAE